MDDGDGIQIIEVYFSAVLGKNNENESMIPEHRESPSTIKNAIDVHTTENETHLRFEKYIESNPVWGKIASLLIEN